MDRSDEKKATAKSYNAGAAFFSDKFNKIEPRATEIAEAFSLLQSKKKNPKVVEIGCGNGLDAEAILRLTTNYLGIDISSEMVKLARKRLPQADFRVADVENFRFPKNTDIVFAFASFIHVSKNSLTNILKRIKRDLATGGIIYIVVKKADRYRKKIVRDRFGARVFYFYTLGNFERISQKVRLQMVRNCVKKSEIGAEWLTIILRKNGN